MVRKEYETKYIHEDGRSNDDLSRMLNTWAEDGYILHSIVPFMVEGTTKGYTIVFELTINED